MPAAQHSATQHDTAWSAGIVTGVVKYSISRSSCHEHNGHAPCPGMPCLPRHAQHSTCTAQPITTWSAGMVCRQGVAQQDTAGQILSWTQGIMPTPSEPHHPIIPTPDPAPAPAPPKSHTYFCVAICGGRGLPLKIAPNSSGPNSLLVDAKVESSTVQLLTRKMMLTTENTAVPK